MQNKTDAPHETEEDSKAMAAGIRKLFYLAQGHVSFHENPPLQGRWILGDSSSNGNKLKVKIL